MQRFLKNFEKSLQLLSRQVFFLCLFLIFYGFLYFLYTEESPELRRISRVSVVTVISYVVAQYGMMRVYGGFSVGRKRTREIILSMSIAVGVTDVLGFMMLTIMQKKIDDVLLLLPIFAIQTAFIILYTKLCTTIYDRLHPPRSLVIFYKERERLPSILDKLRDEQNRFRVSKLLRYDSEGLHRAIRTHDAVMVLDVPDDRKKMILEYCYKRQKEAFFLPGLNDILVNNARHELLGDTSLFACGHTGLSLEQRILKRTSDLLISGLAILLTLPVMAVIAIAIRISDGGPALFRQERVTQGGRLFRLCKFRSMVVGAERDNEAVLAAKDDPRITRVGAFLRKTRLDELPQLFNIFAGQMSLVGPRPERESIALAYSADLPEFRYRLKVKAGLTGLAQTMGKYNTTPKDKLTLDLLYIEGYSFRLDLKILFQTVVVMLTPESTEGFSETDKTLFEDDDSDVE